MKEIKNKTFGEERALYGSKGILLYGCRFDGPEDGESALKESSDIIAEDSYFNLRYPFWHDNRLEISGSELTALCRAAIWYSEDIKIIDTKLLGIKALRECSNVIIKNCEIVSPEFGWSTKNINVSETVAESEYFMLRSENLDFSKLSMKGKYSFQYIKNAEFYDCYFDTKDAFWHAENVKLKDCTVKGEYLGWYSDGLTLENCKIIGTQPLCYCKNLKLINCKMENTDLCFEKSEVEAQINSDVVSIKNPLSGKIKAYSVGEIIMDDDNAHGIIETNNN